MVNGLDSFREKFRDYTDCYTVIGGAACDILMKDSNNNFRATKDIDMIILLEDRYIEFASVFWEYIKEGGYQCGWRQSDLPELTLTLEYQNGVVSLLGGAKGFDVSV